MTPCNPTASALERVLACPSGQVLPAVHDTSEYAERGTQIARFTRSVIAGTSVDVALQAVREEWRDTCRHLEWRKLVGDLSEVRGEVAYAFDTASWETTELGVNIGRRYPLLNPTQIAGSDDIEGVRMDGVPVVRDVKSGQEVTAAQDNPQVKFFALVRMLRTGASEVEAGLRYVREDGRVFADDHVFTAFDLECFADELGEMVERVAAARQRMLSGERLDVSSGPHCRFCPALSACPKYTALAKSMLPELDTIAARIGAMSPEAQGRAWVKAKEIETLLDSVLGSLKAIAKQSAIPIVGGKLVKEIEFSRSDFSQKLAVDLLRIKGATDGEIAGVYIDSRVQQVRMVNDPTVNRTRKRKAA